VLYRWYEEPVGENLYRGNGSDQCRLRGFWPRIGIRTVLTVQPRKMPQGKLAVIRKVARHGRQGRLKPRDRKYSIIAAFVLNSAHEIMAWIPSSPVTWTCWIVGIHVVSITTLGTVVSPACRRLHRVGVCQSYPGACFFFCQRKRTTMSRGRFPSGFQVSSFDP